jgi:hypothetical protein
VAAYVKFDQFVEDLVSKVHDLFGTAGSTADTLKVMLVNSPAPNGATHKSKGDITEITAQFGYAAGGATATNVGTRSTTTVSVDGTNVTFTANGGTVGPFRYAVLYNDTAAAPAKPLVAYWDYTTNLQLNDGESFTVKFNNGATTGNIFTLA